MSDCTKEDAVVSHQLAVDISELLILMSEILGSERYLGFIARIRFQEGCKYSKW